MDHGQHNVISLGGQNELGETHMKMYVSKLGDEFKCTVVAWRLVRW